MQCTVSLFVLFSVKSRANLPQRKRTPLKFVSITLDEPLVWHYMIQTIPNASAIGPAGNDKATLVYHEREPILRWSYRAEFQVRH